MFQQFSWFPLRRCPYTVCMICVSEKDKLYQNHILKSNTTFQRLHENHKHK